VYHLTQEERKTDPSRSLDSKSYNFTPRTIKITILEYMRVVVVDIILVVKGKNREMVVLILLYADQI
jgi:hypothetical protein